MSDVTPELQKDLWDALISESAESELKIGEKTVIMFVEEAHISFDAARSKLKRLEVSGKMTSRWVRVDGVRQKAYRFVVK